MTPETEKACASECVEDCKFGRKCDPEDLDIIPCSICKERKYHLVCLSFPKGAFVPYWLCPSCSAGLKVSISFGKEIETFKARIAKSETEIGELKDLFAKSVSSAGRNVKGAESRIDKVAIDLAEVVVRIDEAVAKLASKSDAANVSVGSVAVDRKGVIAKGDIWSTAGKGKRNNRNPKQGVTSDSCPSPKNKASSASVLGRTPPQQKKQESHSRTAGHVKKRMAVESQPGNFHAVIGDSIVKYVHQHSRGITTICMPGALVANAAEQLEDMKPNLKGVQRALLHFGSNNISNGQAPSRVAAEVMDLLRKAKNDFPDITFGISGVLTRDDVPVWKTRELNNWLGSHCNQIGVPFVDANFALARCNNPKAIDGIHLNRRGTTVFASVLSGRFSGN